MLGHEPPQNMSLASVSGKKDDERTDMEQWNKQEGGGRGGGADTDEVAGREGGEGGEGEENGVIGEGGRLQNQGDSKEGRQSNADVESEQ